jgi:hypothetical protein
VQGYVANFVSQIHSSYAAVVECSSRAFYSIRTSYLFCENSRAIDIVWYGFEAGANGYVHAQNCHAINCGGSGFYSNFMAIMYAPSSKAEQCAFGYRCIQMSTVRRDNDITYGNSTDYSPALHTEGNENSYMT